MPLRPEHWHGTIPSSHRLAGPESRRADRFPSILASVNGWCSVRGGFPGVSVPGLRASDFTRTFS
jgi:hypothetical protein